MFGGLGDVSPGSWRRPASEGGLRRGWALATMAVQVESGHPGCPHDLTDGYRHLRLQEPGSLLLSGLVVSGSHQPGARDQGTL